jgi:hypothetical protein
LIHEMIHAGDNNSPDCPESTAHHKVGSFLQDLINRYNANDPEVRRWFDESGLRPSDVEDEIKKAREDAAQEQAKEAGNPQADKSAPSNNEGRP